VTEEEFIGALGRRWPTTVIGIGVEDLRSEAYLHALRPGVVSDTGPHEVTIRASEWRRTS
jgi:hypothetical protein